MHEFWHIKLNRIDIPAHRALVGELGCACQNFGGCSEGTDPHHVPAVSQGGTIFDVIPLCRFHHDEAGKLGDGKFAAKYSLDYEKLKRRVALYFFYRVGLGKLPEVTPKAKKTTRKNRSKFTKAFVPIDQRPELKA